MKILGISAYYHDAAACLLESGDITAAAQEERFTRKKHDAQFPRHAIDYCLAEAGVSITGLDAVVFYDKPLVKFERLIETYIADAPRGFRSFLTAMPIWLKEKLYLKSLLKKELADLAGSSKRHCRNSYSPNTTSYMRHRLFFRVLLMRQQCCAWTASVNGQQPVSGWARAIS